MILKKVIVLLLSPIYIIISLLKSIFLFFEPLATDIGEGILSIAYNFYNSMYDFWKKVFKWR